MKLRPMLPAVALFSALAALSTAYHFIDPPPNPPADPPMVQLADPAIEAHFVRSVARGMIARDVIAERTTIPEAAALFGWLDSLPPRHRSDRIDRSVNFASLLGPGDYTEAERLGVRVVALVGLLSPSHPATAARVRDEFLTARAEGKFAQLPIIPEDRCEQLLEHARINAEKYRHRHGPVPEVHTGMDSDTEGVTRTGTNTEMPRFQAKQGN